jgi:sigma-B regulation protein RsbU (phosphoserine phosphatase)
MDGAIEDIDIRISNVETAVITAASYAHIFATNKSTCEKLLERLMAANNDIDAVTLLYAPDYFPEEGRYFAPTITRNPTTGELETDEIGGPEHNFCYIETDSNWVYSNKLDANYWCPPYIDSISTKRAMVSFSVPLHHDNGSIYAVLCAKVGLEWVAELVEENKPYEYSKVMVMSRDSQYIYHSESQWIMNVNAISHAKGSKDSDYYHLAQRMIRGEQGSDTLDKSFFSQNHQTEEATIVYYAPVKRIQWSVSYTFPESKIMEEPNQLRANMLILLVVLLVIIAVVLYLVIRVQLWPMKLLVESTHKIEHGDFNAELPQIKTNDEIRNLRDSFEHMQNSLSHYIEELRSTTASKASIESELKVASDIQMSMLPKAFPAYPERDDVDIYGLLTPAKEVGGDLYDFYIRDEKLFFCIGDVSGKGVPAALIMAVTRTLFRTLLVHESQPAKIMTYINEHMSSQNESNMFVTLFIGVLDLPTGRLRYCNAGHEAPLVISQPPHAQEADTKQQTITLPVDPNLPIGIEADWKFHVQETTIDPMSVIFLFTDGLTEAEDAEHNLFGRQRVLDFTANALGQGLLKPQSYIEDVVKAVHGFVGNAEQSDDLTLLAIQYTKQQLDIRFKKSLTLTNNVQEVPLLAGFVDEVCEALEFDMSMTMQMNLAIEEAVVNVMDYAYPSNKTGEILIEAECNEKRLKFTITDSGRPFDPTAKEEADTTLSLEDRPIGGLGIYLVRQFMSSINYERINGKNILTLRKILTKNN